MSVNLLSQVLDLDVSPEVKLKLIHLADNGDIDGLIRFGFNPAPEEYQTDSQNQKEKIPSALRWEIFERDNFTCQNCGARKNLTIDHVIPESKGGTLNKENLQTLCKSCNSRKGTK